jgi:hypothetical protein
LEKKHDWKPVYILNPQRNRKKDALDHFPDAEYENLKSADTNGLPDGTNTRYEPLDGDILQRYQKYRPAILRVMDRLDTGHTFSYDERVRHYHRQLRYWRHQLASHNIDTVVFGGLPHTMAEIPLYFICLEENIDVGYALDSIVPGTQYIEKDFRQENDRLHEIYVENRDKLDHQNVSEGVRQYIENLRTDQPQKPPGAEPVTYRYLSNLIKYVSNLPQYVSKLRENRWRGSKPRKKNIENAEITPIRRIFHEKKVMRHRESLQEKYEQLSEEPDLSKQYIYIPLHYEPERSTIPQGGQFRNQFNVVDILSKTAPDEWRIYVKEHPSQFFRYKTGRGREIYDYHDLLCLENVSLVDHSASTFDLIDNSEAVATVTGTAGWEAVVRGTPALIFGYARYRQCEGTYNISSRSDVDTALEKIRTDGEVLIEDVLKFVRAIEIIGYRGLNFSWEGMWTDTPDSVRVTNTVENLYEFFEGDSAN